MIDIMSFKNIQHQPSEASSDEFNLKTGLEHDYACFAIWNGALYRQDEIVNDILSEFELLADFEINWSEQHYQNNIDRLYERPMREVSSAGWDSKVGPPPFRFLIVRDAQPNYTWKRSVSGVVEPSNERVVAAKYRYRALFTSKYQVHSSNNIEEFLFQTVLVLGAFRLRSVLEGVNPIKEVLHKDLEGADGWENWEELFEVLNIGSRYLVQRNYEGLPDQLLDRDIDFLCDNHQRLASLCGMKQKAGQTYKGSIKVSGAEVSVDVRFIGDRYYPAAWQEDMLRRRQLHEGFYIPAQDDLFFSLLFHCKAQKRQVKPKYAKSLPILAEQLRFDWFSGTDLGDDTECGHILSGYFRARRYYYEEPLDAGVQQNQAVTSMLPTAPGGVNRSTRPRTFSARLRRVAKNLRKIREKLVKKMKRHS